MVRAPRPIDKPQHRLQSLSRRLSHVAFWTQCIRRLDDKRFPPMGPWKTCVLLTLPSQLAPKDSQLVQRALERALFGLSLPFDNRCRLRELTLT